MRLGIGRRQAIVQKLREWHAVPRPTAGTVSTRLNGQSAYEVMRLANGGGRGSLWVAALAAATDVPSPVVCNRRLQSCVCLKMRAKEAQSRWLLQGAGAGWFDSVFWKKATHSLPEKVQVQSGQVATNLQMEQAQLKMAANGSFKTAELAFANINWHVLVQTLYEK